MSEYLTSIILRRAVMARMRIKLGMAARFSQGQGPVKSEAATILYVRTKN